jgi:formylglycine-generating enzyme
MDDGGQTIHLEAALNGSAKIGLPEVLYIFQSAAGLRVDISGWWDLLVPSMQAQKVDAYSLIQTGSDIAGTNILNQPFTGSITGTTVALTSTAGDSFNGTLSGGAISGTYVKPGYGSFAANFTRSTFHFTSFSPGEALNGPKPSFAWTPGAGAEKYFIRVMKDNAQHNCNEAGGCAGIWEKDGITANEVVFNVDGTAQESFLRPGNNYRVRVYSRINSQTGIPDATGTFLDTTEDVAFWITSPATPAGMILILGGSFQMGDAIDGMSGSMPVHTVTLSNFYLDRYEVTKALWDDVYTWATAHGYAFDNAGAGAAASHPVHSVSWYDVVKWLNARSEKEGRTPVYYTDTSQTAAYTYKTGQVDVTNAMVKWTANGYRLPTEAEWEYAARAGTTTRFYTGDCISTDRANYNGNSPGSGCPAGQYRGGTTAVGSFAANPWGLYDMAGNVWAWTWDGYMTPYSGSETNPRGPDARSSRVVRGGCWHDSANLLRSANRSNYYPYSSYVDLGFRSALSLP